MKRYPSKTWWAVARGTLQAAAFLSVFLLTLQLNAPALASEQVLWQLGQPDRSEHEFSALPDSRSNREVVVRLDGADPVRQWPKFHPGSGNGAFGGRPYRYTLVFQLPPSQPAGVFHLDLSLLFRQPRAPVLDLELNGHRGQFYFEPEPMFEIGNTDDQFNPIRSVQRRVLTLPARLFRPGENRLTLTAVDEPSKVVQNRTVGGSGDSGFSYDALALRNDPQAALDEKLEASLIPTAMFPKTAKGVRQECQLVLRLAGPWPGGKASLSLGKFNAELELPAGGEFGEARATMLLPEDLPAGTARVQLAGALEGARVPKRSCTVDFTPARKWKVFYAPNMHLDIGYTDYRPKVAEAHSRSVDNLLKVLAEHPGYRFNLDGSWIAEQWLATRSSEQAAKLAANARAGRIGMNALYASFVTDYPSFETFVRSLYLSKELQGRLGIPFDFANITDIPGNSWSVPSVLASAGIRYFADGGNQDRGPLIALGHWNVRSPFWWEGPDGQRVLTWFSSHYHQLKAVAGLPPSIESAKGGLSRFIKTYARADYLPDAVLLYGTEVENLPMDYDDAAFVEQWNKEFAYPKIVTCRFSQFFEYLERHYGGHLPVVRGEAGAYWGDNAGIFAWGTARDRGNQSRIVGAEALSSLTATLEPELRFPRELDHDIWHNLLLFTEHTYGSHRTRGQPEHDEAVGQLKDKEDQTLRAEADIDKLMRRAMSQLADQIQTDGQNLIVFNPLSWTRSGFVTFTVEGGTTLTNIATGETVNYEVLARKDGALTIRFPVHEVPSLGYQVYRLGRGSNAPASGAIEKVADNILENRFYRITLEPARAAIKSLYDKDLGRELVDPSSPYLLNEYLFVSGGGTETGRGAGAENTQLLTPFSWLPPAELIIHHPEGGMLTGVEKTSWGRRIRMTASALHTPRIESELWLADNEKRLELRNRIQVDLGYAKQASYFAFPWAVNQPTFRYDIANGFVDPASDLLEGACSEWFSVQNLISASDSTVSVDLAVVDSPLICLGDIYRGHWPRRFTFDSSTVFSYVLNNYWSPKWGGKKSAELLNRYVITSSPRFDGATAARFGRDARTPLEVAELKLSDKLAGSRGTLPSGQAALAALTPANLVVSALKAAEDGRGLVVRVQELAGRDTEGVLKFPLLAVTSAREANAVEVPGKPLVVDADGVHVHLKANQVLTVRLVAVSRPNPKPREVTSASEPLNGAP